MASARCTSSLLSVPHASPGTRPKARLLSSALRRCSRLARRSGQATCSQRSMLSAYALVERSVMERRSPEGFQLSGCGRAEGQQQCTNCCQLKAAAFFLQKQRRECRHGALHKRAEVS